MLKIEKCNKDDDEIIFSNKAIRSIIKNRSLIQLCINNNKIESG
jgi:hypothetical protein